MAKSEEVMTGAIKGELYGQTMALLHSFEPYRNDEQLFNAEVLEPNSNLSKRLDRAHELAAKRKMYAAALGTATVAEMAAALDDLATVPAEPDPTQPLLLLPGEDEVE